MTFNDRALGHEPAFRLSAFLGVFALMAIWKTVAPRWARLFAAAAALAAGLLPGFATCA